LNLLLDTHVLIWTFTDDPSLSQSARDAIIDPGNLVFASAASVWEIAIKRAIGKLRVPDDVNNQIEAHRFEPLAMTTSHAWTAGNLPPHHQDPFDRMLIGQAIEEDLTILTRDVRFDTYGVPLIRA